jgi:hypothetical protein
VSISGKGNHMKTKNLHLMGVAVALFFLAGCETTAPHSRTSSNTPPTLTTDKRFAVYYKATDGRRIKIGENRAENNGLTFKDPHMDKCWIADGFDFEDYDTLVVLPTLSAVTVETNSMENFALARENVVREMTQQFAAARLFPNIVTAQSDVKSGARVLVMENTITEFKRGGGAARFWAGEFGAGQPVTRIATKITDGNRVVFACEARRSGVSAEARVLLPHSTTIQLQDIHSLVLDLTDFIAVMEGKYQPVN